MAPCTRRLIPFNLRHPGFQTHFFSCMPYVYVSAFRAYAVIWKEIIMCTYKNGYESRCVLNYLYIYMKSRTHIQVCGCTYT